MTLILSLLVMVTCRGNSTCFDPENGSGYRYEQGSSQDMELAGPKVFKKKKIELQISIHCINKPSTKINTQTHCFLKHYNTLTSTHYKQQTNTLHTSTQQLTNKFQSCK